MEPKYKIVKIEPYTPTIDDRIDELELDLNEAADKKAS